MSLKIIVFFLIGLIFNFIFTTIIHAYYFRQIEKKKVNIKESIKGYLKDKFNNHKNIDEVYSLLLLVFKIVCGIIFSDINVADFFKRAIGQDKENRKKYITKLNHVNLTISIFFIVLSFINCDVVCASVIIPFIVIRALSRSYEILIAFTNDIIDKKSSKSSALSSSDRLKLAINSFFEIIINYSIVYHLMNFIAGINISTLQYENMFVSLMKSIGISTLTNVGDLTLISIMQLLSSMSLIYFGLAGYIGSNEKE